MIVSFKRKPVERWKPRTMSWAELEKGHRNVEAQYASRIVHHAWVRGQTVQSVHGGGVLDQGDLKLTYRFLDGHAEAQVEPSEHWTDKSHEERMVLLDMMEDRIERIAYWQWLRDHALSEDAPTR